MGILSEMKRISDFNHSACTISFLFIGMTFSGTFFLANFLCTNHLILYLAAPAYELYDIWRHIYTR